MRVSRPLRVLRRRLPVSAVPEGAGDGDTMTLMSSEAEFTASIAAQQRATEAHENAVHSGSASAELVPAAEPSQGLPSQRRLPAPQDPA